MPLFVSRRRLERATAEAVTKALALGPGAPVNATGVTPIANPQAAQAQYAGMFVQAGTTTPVAVDQAMTAQGFDQSSAFGPGRPIQPFAGYGVQPRAFDYAAGANITARPRQGARAGFDTLRQIVDSYDVARICINHRIDDVRSLDWHIDAADGYPGDVTAAVTAATALMRRPDGRTPFSAWLSMWLEDVLRYDAGALYRRRDKAGRVIALEVVDGTTIAPQLDFYGRRPAYPAPAFVQYIEGLPWDWLTDTDLIYQPFRPQPDNPYGLAPIEAMLLTANADIRFQWHFLQYFTEGAMPGGIMEAPPDVSDPEQIALWQSTWDAVMEGDQAKKHQIRWVPAGTKFTPTRDYPFDDKFPLYLLHKTCAAFGVTPNDLGFTETVNRATGDTQVDVQFRTGTLPLIRHVEGILTSFLADDLGLPVKFTLDTGQEKEDRETLAKAWQIGVFTGAVGVDEMRAEVYGLPVDNDRPTPRFVLDSKTGPVPLRSLYAIAGPTDPETLAPIDTVPLDVTPFDGAEGILPAKMPGGAEFKRAPTDPDDPAFPADEHQTGTDIVVGTAAPAPLNPVTGAPVVKDATAGVTSATGIVGYNLHGSDDEEDEDDEDEEVAKELRRWQSNSRSRVRKGLTPRRFSSDVLTAHQVDTVWDALAGATDREQVDAAFAVVKAGRPKGEGPAGRWAGHNYDLKIVAHYEDDLRAHLDRIVADLIPAAVAFVETPPVTKDAITDVLATLARSQLAGPDISPASLAVTIQQIWADGWQTGVHAGLVSLGTDAQVGGGLELVVSDVKWSDWTPGDPAAARMVYETAHAGLRELLSQAGITIKGAQTVADGIISTNLDRVAQIVAEGVSTGASSDTVARSLRAITVDSDRAQMIAQTETARAQSAAAMATYRYNGIRMMSWLLSDGACPECEENDAASPISIDDEWPNGSCPVHPRCRCAVAPASSA